MRRKLFTLAAGVSALVCLAAAYGWGDSYRNARSITWNGGHPRDSGGERIVYAISLRGITHLSSARLLVSPRSPVRRREFYLDTLPAGSFVISPDRWSRAGFQFQALRRPGVTGYSFGVPYWFWLVATATLPSLWMIRRRRARRGRAVGCCPTCGYDLRATPARCPECGRRADERVKGREGRCGSFAALAALSPLWLT